MRDLPINADRLAASLDELGTIGRDHRDGSINRICVTPVERQAHDMMATWMTAVGLRVTRDAFGNTIGTRPGRGAGGSIAIGSHLDSVPRGGNYDGAAGVVGALEVVRALDDADVRTEHDLTLVCFSAEEGARFGKPCLGSKAAVEGLGDDELALSDRDGVSLRDALAAVGMRPLETTRPAPWTRDVAAFLELHIEQGRVLQEAGEDVGVVDCIAGNRRLRMRLRGQTDHSGATPMRLRRDALVAAAEVVVAVHRLVRRAEDLVGTVGELTVHPGAMTAVPGRVDLGVDVRGTDARVQERTIQQVIEAARAACRDHDVELEVDDVSDVPPVELSPWLRDVVAGAARRVTGRARVLTSGAGHDAGVTARRIPTSVIFIPCRDGVSHSPAEWAAPEHLATGTQVLAQAVLDVDAQATTAAAVRSREQS
ncbi:Zn-dependent hydrolase [Actinophytocola sp.]|uniref:Zn-dependent hydrolase n=1 Tax=Actinophytocola sp. TaxID=1872138 RepID=UPI003D6A2B77